MRALAIALVGAAACANVVDTGELASIDDYQDWYSFDVTGSVSGHGKSYRILYVNDIARTWLGAGTYPAGTTVVKEIYGLDDTGGPGAFRYIAIARKLDEAPPGGALQDGWLFTYLGKLGGDEDNRSSCYASCHVAAPYDGLFHDLGF